MLPPTTDPSREQLGFRHAVLEAFAFLLARGFRVASADATQVRYESGEVFVDVHHGRSSYEVSATIGLLGPSDPRSAPPVENYVPGNAYSLWEVAMLAAADDITEQTFLQASTRLAVSEAVAKLSSTMRSYAGSALDGDPAFFNDLGKARAASFASYQRRVEMARVRRELSAAWSCHDYREVVRLLDPVVEQLTPSEIRKLAFSKTQLATSR